MLNKIALKSLRQKWRDYSVLVIGSLIAVAIFYMFSAIATNEPLLKSMSTMTKQVIVIVFVFGEIFLGIITFVYLNFANNFLLRLRQKDYGLLAMLGASKRQVGGLLMRETLFIGVIATAFGILVGAGLTKLSGQTLMDLIGIKIKHWAVFTPKAILITVVFFLVVFLLNGLYNRWRLKRVDTLTLLHADETTMAKPEKPVRQLILGLLGLIILGGSYALMPSIPKLRMTGMVIALILNGVGTYLFVGQTLGLITNWMRRSDFGQRGLRLFLNGQLSFRLNEYKRIFTMIAVLFGLALGAISVGQGYYVSLPKQAEENNPVTLMMRKPDAKLSGLNDVTYQAEIKYRVHDGQVDFEKQDLANAKVPTLTFNHPEDTHAKPKRVTLNVNAPHADEDYTLTTWAAYLAGMPYGTKVNLVDQLPKQGVQTFKAVSVRDMQANQKPLEKLYSGESRYTDHGNLMVPGAYGNFVMLKSIFGGLEFMSVFLGIAFLVMLASTLMFKVLSNVSQDRHRYQILRMIGTTPAASKMATIKDVGILFFIPMVIGILDTVFGLQSFKPIMMDPYIGLGNGLLIVGGVYLLYFVVTVFIYQRLVLKK
ncbi:ABC transporter permease [Weissella viridescens]|uniref:ABC transporter permease n=1 Tax=Weissella viridescens TaxID=1629 RepID=A0A3P2RAA9_WEIVI|nr:ABC transporter permease [Weissella viridescens]RRG17769.1 ABC transporter permease [Weissella viridescens]